MEANAAGSLGLTSANNLFGKGGAGGLTTFEPREVERILIPAVWMIPDAVEQSVAASLDA